MPVKHRKAVAIMDTMYDWRNMTTGAGYERIAPTYYRINPANLSGKRLYDWLGKRGQFFDDLVVTNACKELGTSSNSHGTPDPKWLEKNLLELYPFDLLLVCGKVAYETYHPGWAHDARIVELPHPAARTWTKAALARAAWFIREGTVDYNLTLSQGRLIAKPIIPF